MLTLKRMQPYVINKEKNKNNDILFVKDIFNQLIILFNLVFSTIQDIENSVTFCKLNTLYSSVIKSQDLFLEIQKIASHYKNTLPFEVKYENILDFEYLIKINCKIDKNACAKNVSGKLKTSRNHQVLLDWILQMPCLRHALYKEK